MSGIGTNPNMLHTPNILPPYPLWSPSITYFFGDVVTYAGQNWVAMSPGIGSGTPPDHYPITFNNVPGKSPGLYLPNDIPPFVQNLNGGRWLNLTLATPPAPAWSPAVNYLPGNVVMYPPESPGTFWRCVFASFNNIPQTPFFQAGSLGLPIAPQNWELLNNTNAPVGAPAVGVPVPPPVIEGLATFTASVVAQTIVCNWTIPVGVTYSGYNLSLNGGTPVVLSNGALLTYTFTGLSPGTFGVVITPFYLSFIAPSSSVSGLVVLPPPAAPSFTALNFLTVNPVDLAANEAEFFMDLGPSTSVDIVQNADSAPVTLLSGITGVFSSLANVASLTYTFPNYIVVRDSTTPTLQSDPISFEYNEGDITVSGFSVSLGTAGDPDIVSWTTPPVPTVISGSPAVTSPAFVYQLYRTINGGSLASLTINGLVPGPQTYTDNTGYSEGDTLVYILVPKMTYTLNGCLIQQGGVNRTATGVVPP